MEAFLSVLDASWWDFSDFQAKKGHQYHCFFRKAVKPEIFLVFSMDFGVRCQNLKQTSHKKVDLGGFRKPLEASWRPLGAF